ncbi:MAG: FkbM family methyltransferase [archaeon]
MNVSLHFENKKVRMSVNHFSYISQLAMILDVWVKDQYDAFKSVKNKIVFDVGANQGVFSIYAATLGAKKVYAFEPVPETFKVLQENIRLNKLGDKIIPIQAGVGDKEQESIIYYDQVGDAGASFCESPGKMNKIKVKIVTIDEFVRKEKIPRVDFIKIDTEGFEKEVLLGAKETIREWKPILSLSAYHRPEDKKTLPEVIKSIRSDYNIKLNKYGDEDFYCY